MKRVLSLLAVLLGTLANLHGQATSRMVDPLLHQDLQAPAVVADELRRFMLPLVPPLVLPSGPKQWDTESARMRAQELATIYHGWPQSWIDSAPKFEKVGVIERPGYRIIKMRYEIVPGFYSSALLYEPEHMAKGMPAILDVNGHGPGGKAVEHKQKRCINQARRGIVALSLEWFNFGDLNVPGNDHDKIGLLELAGDNGLGLFYLAMRRGLDYLDNDPDVDRSRIGMTGLSGGGWQTIVLGSLDTRVGPAVAVAGFSSLTTSIEHPEYHDPEQNAADVRRGIDYAQLDAMRAPRPTMLIYNAMDDCCFRADIVKQGVYTDIQPFYQLYGKPENFQWHLNLDPGTHNYGIDSRQVSYRFFDSEFHLQASANEYPDTDTEVRSYADLVVGLPKDNLTILTLAQSIARTIHHEIPADHGAEWAQSQRALLQSVVRDTPVKVVHAWPIHTTHQQGVQSNAYRFEFSNGLSATGVLLRSLTAPEIAPTTVIISDLGMASTVDDVANDVDRGQRVLVFEPLFFGENVPGDSGLSAAFAELLNGVGERPLGLESAQLIGVIRWLAEDMDHGSSTPHSWKTAANPTVPSVHMVTTGLRSETVAMVSAALEPTLFSRLEARKAIPNMMDLFEHPVNYQTAPELMCLDLYRDFDFNVLAAMASPTKVNLAATAPERIFWH